MHRISSCTVRNKVTLKICILFFLCFFFLLNSEIFQVVIGEVSEQSVSHHENAEGINVQSTFFFFFFDCAVK